MVFWSLFDAAIFTKELILNIGGDGAMYLGLHLVAFFSVDGFLLSCHVSLSQYMTTCYYVTEFPY